MQLKKVSSLRFDAILRVMQDILDAKDQKELAEQLGIKSPAISDARKKRGAVPDTWYAKFEELTAGRPCGKTTRDDVEAMTDELLQAAMRNQPDNEFSAVRKAGVKLSAGGGTLVYDDGFEGEYYFRTKWLSHKCAPNNAVLFEVEGASMEPTIAEGGVVLVNTGVDADEWQDNKIYALRIGDSVRIKRLRPSPRDHRIMVVSDNKSINQQTGEREYPDELFEPEELHVIGQVFWHAKEL